MQIAADGTAFETAGTESAPVVALIHGLGLTHRTWDAVLPDLLDRYRVLVYDLPGHGATPPPLDAPSLRTYSAQLRDLLVELGIDSCAVVGFSLGGMINRRLAMEHPSMVDALVILNSPHERSADAQELVEQRARDSAAGGPEATIDATLERWFTARFRHERPDVVASVRDGVLANPLGPYADARWVLAHGVVELIRPDPPIAVPTLVMTCEHDSGSTPAMSHAIASEIEGAETIIVPELQHMGLVERPDLFTEPILEFLGRAHG